MYVYARHRSVMAIKNISRGRRCPRVSTRNNLRQIPHESRLREGLPPVDSSLTFKYYFRSTIFFGQERYIVLLL